MPCSDGYRRDDYEAAMSAIKRAFPDQHPTTNSTIDNKLDEIRSRNNRIAQNLCFAMDFIESQGMFDRMRHANKQKFIRAHEWWVHHKAEDAKFNEGI